MIFWNLKFNFIKHMVRFTIIQNIKINLKIIKIQKNLMCESKFWVMLIRYKIAKEIYSEQVCEVIEKKKVSDIN